MRWLIRLYPRIWRERYEEEMRALLEEHKMTMATFFDLVFGAIDAHLNYDGDLKGRSLMVNQKRSSIVMIFCSFVIYGLGWSLLQRLTDPMPQYQTVAHSHPLFNVLFYTDFFSGCLAFLALMLGGLPLIVFSIKRALSQKQKNVLLPFGIAVGSLIVFLVSTAIVANWHTIGFVTRPYVFFGCYFVVFLLLLIIGTASIALVIARTDFKLSVLKFVTIPKIILLGCIVISIITSATLMICIFSSAPQLFHSQDVGGGMFITGLFLMTLATLLAVLGFRRGTIKETNF